MEGEGGYGRLGGFEATICGSCVVGFRRVERL